MKTNSFLLGAAVLMLATACSNDEVVKTVENSKAIGFSSFVNNSTRATDLTEDNLNDLQVWGVAQAPTGTYNVFGGDLVNKTITNGELTNTEWKYENTRYWVAGSSYTFSAVAPAAATGATVNPGSTMDGAVESIDFTNNGLVDLLFGAENVAASDNLANYGTVNFTLGHILSRVKFGFKNELAKGYFINVKNVTVKDATETAKFDAIAGTWGESTGTADYGFTMPTDDTASESTAASEPSYLIPTDNAVPYVLTFTVELLQEDAISKKHVPIHTYDYSVTLPETNYERGNSYAFNTVIKAENMDQTKPIEFNVSVSPWTDADDQGFNTPVVPAVK